MTLNSFSMRLAQVLPRVSCISKMMVQDGLIRLSPSSADEWYLATFFGGLNELDGLSMAEYRQGSSRRFHREARRQGLHLLYVLGAIISR